MLEKALHNYLYAYWPRNKCEVCWAVRLTAVHFSLGVTFGALVVMCGR